MSEKTEISWCDSTVNFVSGCEKVSPGCANCYITSTAPFRVSGRKHGDDPVVHESAFALARRLNKKQWICNKCGYAQCENDQCYKCGHEAVYRRRIFALSLSDFLWDRIPVPVLARIFDTMRVCDKVDWLLCTKRPEAFSVAMLQVIMHCETAGLENLAYWVRSWWHGSAPKHIWIGTTIENQAMADKRVPELLKIPAAVRFLSVEPLLEPVDLAKAGALWSDMNNKIVPRGVVLGGISWVIVGGESGSLSRPCNISWIRSIKDQCAEANVPCFVKQMGSKALFQTADAQWAELRTKKGGWHPKGGDPSEWPEDLRVRQWPESMR